MRMWIVIVKRLNKMSERLVASLVTTGSPFKLLTKMKLLTEVRYLAPLLKRTKNLREIEKKKTMEEKLS